MTMNPAEERLHDLLIQEATESLDAAGRAELAALIAAHPTERDAYERLAAELSLAADDDAGPLPAALAARVTAVGEAYVGGVTPLVPRRAVAPVARRTGGYGWHAAAAALLLAILGWYPRLADTPQSPVAAQNAVPDYATARAALLARPGVVTTSFSGPPDAASASASATVAGDVVWDPATQRGYLRLRGLPANDPAATQYQLWVFDGGRDPKYPVDGGVFDVHATEVETIVPIRVPLKVGQAVLFAVTVERPGGVVVSGREHIVALAKPSTT